MRSLRSSSYEAVLISGLALERASSARVTSASTAPARVPGPSGESLPLARLALRSRPVCSEASFCAPPSPARAVFTRGVVALKKNAIPDHQVTVDLGHGSNVAVL